MRIIAGKHRSRKLMSLEGNDTRPTQDKIKEAIFSSIGTYFDGGRVLDLFAGSGSVGLECLSRGMKEAYFCDCNKAAIQIVEQNCEALKEASNCTIVMSDYQSMLKQCENLQFDLVFIDPPYALKVHDEIMMYIASKHMVSEYGDVIVETHKEDTLQDHYMDLVKVKEKCYGITKVSYYRKEQR